VTPSPPTAMPPPPPSACELCLSKNKTPFVSWLYCRCNLDLQLPNESRRPPSIKSAASFTKQRLAPCHQLGQTERQHGGADDARSAATIRAKAADQHPRHFARPKLSKHRTRRAARACCAAGTADLPPTASPRRCVPARLATSELI
jgi:hypothetical protein